MTMKLKSRMLELAQHLQEPVIVDIKDVEGIDELANAIKTRNYYADSNKIRENCKIGLIAEQAVMQATGATKSGERVIYDLLYKNEYRIEVKSTQGSWLGNNSNRLSTLIKYYMAIDFLILAKVEPIENDAFSFKVSFKYVSKCYKFMDYFKDSVQVSGPRYYDHKSAAKDGNCVIL